MVLAAISPSALQGCHECSLSQVDTHPDITLDIARMEDSNKQTRLNETNMYLIRATSACANYN